jgi:hypothetical protein
MRLSRLIQIRERRPRLDVGTPFSGIHPDVLHVRKIDGQAIVAEGVTGDVVSGAANRNFELIPPRKRDGRWHIVSVRALHDYRGSAIDHGIPDLASFLVAGVIGNHDPPLDHAFKLFSRR